MSLHAILCHANRRPPIQLSAKAVGNNKIRKTAYPVGTQGRMRGTPRGPGLHPFGTVALYGSRPRKTVASHSDFQHFKPLCRQFLMKPPENSLHGIALILTHKRYQAITLIGWRINRHCVTGRMEGYRFQIASCRRNHLVPYQINEGAHHFYHSRVRRQDIYQGISLEFMPLGIKTCRENHGRRKIFRICSHFGRDKTVHRLAVVPPKSFRIGSHESSILL